MSPTLQTLVQRLDNNALCEANVIPWSCPVPSFGDLRESTIATLGLNPSNREFVDGSGNELDGSSRRFHTLKSLGLARWSKASSQHLRLIAESCRRYFSHNPYDGWFRKLDALISGTRASYYHQTFRACHLDLIPYATACKWTELTQRQRTMLLEYSGDALGLLLRDSPVRLVILNGRTVVDTLQMIANVDLECEKVSDWTLPRRSSSGVVGFGYRGVIREIGGVKLRREIVVLGFNHNIQSSFGVTNKVKDAIRRWITHHARKALS